VEKVRRGAAATAQSDMEQGPTRCTVRAGGGALGAAGRVEPWRDGLPSVLGAASRPSTPCWERPSSGREGQETTMERAVDGGGRGALGTASGPSPSTEWS